MNKIEIYLGDCLEKMKLIEDESVDFICCDLPYGKTACDWDIVLPFDLLWEQYNRIIKTNGAIALFGREPFTRIMIASNIKNYKHKWVWNKKQSGSFHTAKYMPLQIEEDIIIFAKHNSKVCYYPIMRKGKFRYKGGATVNNVCNKGLDNKVGNYNDLYYPTNIIEIANPRLNRIHETEKPILLYDYLIKTYTKENDLVLDNCFGSCNCGKSSIINKRNFIGIEKEKKYFDIACKHFLENKYNNLDFELVTYE